jgi:hypothetical protein
MVQVDGRAWLTVELCDGDVTPPMVGCRFQQALDLSWALVSSSGLTSSCVPVAPLCVCWDV